MGLNDMFGQKSDLRAEAERSLLVNVWADINFDAKANSHLWRVTVVRFEVGSERELQSLPESLWDAKQCLHPCNA